MGGSGSKAKTSVISASKAVAEAYLYTHQDIAQGVNTDQIVAINCDNNMTNQLCIDCLRSVREAAAARGSSTEDEMKLAELCDTCQCNIKDIDLTQNIVVNFTATQSASAAQDFATAVDNAITNQTNQQDGITSFNNKVDTVTEVTNDLFTRIASVSVQQSLQQLKNTQTIVLNSPGNVTNVKAAQAVDFVSNILQTSDQTAQAISKLSTQVLNAATQVTTAGLDQLIIIFIYLGLIGFILLLVYVAFNTALSAAALA